MPHVLVLNASYEPLGVVPLRRALVLVLENKAVCLEESGAYLHSESQTLPAPSVVRLKRFVRVPYRGPVPLTRRALFARDGGRCMYCGQTATSVDHVIPRSRGGRHVWDNVVASCRRCNHVKADRHLREIGWRLKHPPAPPTGLAWRIIGTGHRDPRWLPYLQPYGAQDALARIDAVSAAGAAQADRGTRPERTARTERPPRVERQADAGRAVDGARAGGAEREDGPGRAAAAGREVRAESVGA